MEARSNNIETIKIEITVRRPASANVDPHAIAHALFGSGQVRRSGGSAWAARVSGWTRDREFFEDKATGV